MAVVTDRDTVIRVYEAVHAAEEQRSYDRWHASALAKCPKEQYLLRQGVPKVRIVGGGLQIRWQVGHKVEEAVRPYLNSIFPELQSNVRIESEKWDLTGEYDNFAPITDTLIEVKSVHPYAFLRSQAGESDHLRDKKPYLHHEYQNHGYALLMRDELGIEVKAIKYLYVSLDGRMACYETPVQSDLLEKVEKRLHLLNDCWQKQIAPECWCHDTKHPLYDCSMKWCDYQQEGQECCQEAA